MPSLTVPLSREKPICGQRLSTAYTWPLYPKSATTCCLASTVKRPSACSAARVATRTHWSSAWGWACAVRVIPCLLGRGSWTVGDGHRTEGRDDTRGHELQPWGLPCAGFSYFQRKNFRKDY